MSFSNEEQTGMACTTSVMIGGCAVTLEINENQLIPGDLPIFPRRVLARMFGIYQQLHQNNLWLGCDGIRVSVLPFNPKVINLEFVFLKALTMDFVAAIHDENIELFRNSRPCYWSNISYENRTVRQVAVTNDTNTNNKVLRLTVTFYGEHLADERVYGVGPLSFRESLERLVTTESLRYTEPIPDPQQTEQKIISHLKTKHFGEQQRLATLDIVAALRWEWDNLTFSIDHAVHEKFVVTLQSPRMLVVGDHLLDRIHRIIKDRGLEREINVHIGTLACLDDSPYTPDNVASENSKVLEAAGITIVSSGRPTKRPVRRLATANPPPELSSFVVRITVKKAHIDGAFVSSQMPPPSSSSNRSGHTMQQFPTNRDPLPDDAIMGTETMYSSTRRPAHSGFASPQPKRRKTTNQEADSGLVSPKGAYAISSYGRN